MKRIIRYSAILLAAAACADPADPQISNVRLNQNSISRRVTVKYDLDEAAVVTMDVLTNGVSIGGANIQHVSGDCFRQVAAGNDHIVEWDPYLSWPDQKFGAGVVSVRMTAWALDNTPDYMAVDITATGGADTQTYYPAADFVPGGVTNGIYKTTKLLMRKIMAKGVEWTMGSTTLETQNRQAAREATHQVTLTNNYYIGVYEVTQSQWSQVATNSTISANFTTERFMRPMEKVCYNEIRLKYDSNAAATADEIANYSWPKKPNPSSFLGLLRSKTGLDFDLPSEAQWEFAARAGNGVGYWNDGSAILNTNPDDNLKLLGRYERNGGKVLSGTSYIDPAASCDVTNGTAIVGSYLPNAWGLYDMHGNVWEWCLDWSQDNIATAKDASDELYGGRVNIDPSNPANYLSGASASGAARVRRGGSWNNAAGVCRPAIRSSDAPTTRNICYGFRVLCTAGLQ